MITIAPVTRKVQREAVARWHRTHRRSTPGERIALGAFFEDRLVSVVVLGSPPEALDDGKCWSVVRLACGPKAPKYTASRLLGAASRLMDAAGVTLQVSYTRVDERGSCYSAANWLPVALCPGRPHTTGNRSQRWLPGLYDPSAEIVDLVRWERGPRARRRDLLRWNGEIWKAAR